MLGVDAEPTSIPSNGRAACLDARPSLFSQPCIGFILRAALGQCPAMSLEPIETAQLWVATVAGLAGLAGVLWQVYQHFSGRKEETNWKLNRTVLKPWSGVKIVSLYDHDQYNRIMLGIPKEALPSDVA